MLNTNYKSRPLSLSFLIKALILPLIVILIIILFILPLEIPYSFKVPGQVLAAEEYMIIKGRDGQLITLLRNNKTGMSKSYSAAEFERGDNARFVMNPGITLGSLVSVNDTIGSIISNELEVRLTQLKGQLNVARALLNQNLSGQKEPLIKEAKDNLDYALRRVELDRKMYERQKQLFEKEFISEEEFDIIKNTLELDEIAVEIAKAQLETVTTGEKKEQIDWIRSQVAALEKEIIVLEKKSASFNLTAPLNGYVRWIPEGDTLLVISDTSEYVIKLAVPLDKHNYISPNANVIISQSRQNVNANAEIVIVNQSVEYLFSRPVLFASAFVTGEQYNLIPGLRVECKVECGKLKLSEHIKRIMNSEIF